MCHILWKVLTEHGKHRNDTIIHNLSLFEKGHTHTILIIIMISNSYICDTIWSIEAKVGIFQNWAIDSVIEHSISEFVWSKPHVPTLFGYKVMNIYGVYFLMYFIVFCSLFWPVSQFHIYRLWPPWTISCHNYVLFSVINTLSIFQYWPPLYAP